MQVTLRFFVASITENAGGSHQVILNPDYAHGANADWSQYTPSGNITLNLSTKASVEFYTDALRAHSTVGITMEVVEPTVVTPYPPVVQ